MKSKLNRAVIFSIVSLSVFNVSAESLMKDAYKDAFKIGFAVNDEITADDTGQRQILVLKHANTVTLENSMKAEIISPNRGEFQFDLADQFVNFGQTNGLFIIGHTLVWHNQTPQWFFEDKQGKPNNSKEQREQMRLYIEKVVSRYKGKVHAWDVVNEIIGEDGEYRDTIWVKRMGGGDEVVKAAFKYAEQYASDTELYYNDFNAWRPAKRDGIVRMVKMLQAEGIRIDGIGIQAHWGLNFPKNEYIEQAIKAYASLGLKVIISELDIDVLPLTKEGQIIGQSAMHPQFRYEEFETFLDPYTDGLPVNIQRELAERYRSLFEIFYRHKKDIDRVTFWGVDDSMSWKNDYPIPERTNYPLIWSRDLTAKPALEEILQVPALKLVK